MRLKTHHLLTHWILYWENKTSLCTSCEEPGKRIQNLESSEHASADKVKWITESPRMNAQYVTLPALET